MVLHSTSSLTALEQDVATTGTMGQWLGSTATHDNKQVLAYSSGAGNQMFAATQSTTGWSSELVRTGANLASSIEVHVDSQNVPHLVYRHDATSQLELAVGGSVGRSLRWAMRVKRFQRSTRCCAFKRFSGCRFGLFERHRNQPCGVDLRRYDPVPPQRHKPHRPQQRNQPRHVNQRLAAPRCADDQRRPPRSSNGLEARTGLNTPSHNQAARPVNIDWTSAVEQHPLLPCEGTPYPRSWE